MPKSFFGGGGAEGISSRRPSRTNNQKRCPFHYRGLECKSRKSRNTRANLALEYRMKQGKG